MVTFYLQRSRSENGPRPICTGFSRVKYRNLKYIYIKRRKKEERKKERKKRCLHHEKIRDKIKNTNKPTKKKEENRSTTHTHIDR